MAPEDEAAVEPEQEVLPNGLDALETPAVKLVGDAGRSGARMRRLDFDDLADERLQTPGRAMK